MDKPKLIKFLKDLDESIPIDEDGIYFAPEDAGVADTSFLLLQEINKGTFNVD